jgi:hypothetical protein
LYWTKQHWNRSFSEFFSFPINIIQLLLHIHSCIIWEQCNVPISSHSYIETQSPSVTITMHDRHSCHNR